MIAATTTATWKSWWEWKAMSKAPGFQRSGTLEA